jgi:hypothetical protein
MQIPEEIAQSVFDQWYADAASFTGPTARRECIAIIAAALRDYGAACAAEMREQSNEFRECLSILLDRISEDRLGAYFETGLKIRCRAAIRALPTDPPEPPAR